MHVEKKTCVDSRQAILRSAITLFLEKGFSGATAHAICEHAGMTTGGMFNYFASKEAVLYEIIGQMFKTQFEAAEKLLPNKDPALLYGVETAMQLYIAELNESLRDVYVAAYSLP